MSVMIPCSLNVTFVGQILNCAPPIESLPTTPLAIERYLIALILTANLVLCRIVYVVLSAIHRLGLSTFCCLDNGMLFLLSKELRVNNCFYNAFSIICVPLPAGI